MVTFKTYIITLLAAIIMMAALFFYGRYQTNQVLDAAKDVYKKEMQQATLKRDAEIKNQSDSIKKLIDDNKAAKEQGAYWYAQAKQRSVNPNYDYDFITAAGIISNSHYKPGE